MMMLVQSEGCCAPGCARGTFALSSILGYQKVLILAILNLDVAPMPSIMIQLNPIYSLGEFIFMPPWAAILDIQTHQF